MQKIIVILFSMLLISGQSCYAADLSYDRQIREKASLPEKWFTCKTKTDCALAAVPCMASLAINLAHKTEAEPIICKAYGNCTVGCDKSMEDTSGLDCIENQCVTILGMVKPKMDPSPLGFELKDMHAVPTANPK